MVRPFCLNRIFSIKINKTKSTLRQSSQGALCSYRKIKPPGRLAANKTKPLQQGGYPPVCFTLPSSAEAGGLQSTAGVRIP